MQTSSVIVFQLMLMPLLIVSTHKAFSAQPKIRQSTTHLGAYEDFRGLFGEHTSEPITSQSTTSYAQQMADGDNQNLAELKSNRQLFSQFSSRTPILLRTLFRTVDNGVVIQKAPVETSSRFFSTPNQTFRSAKTSRESAAEGEGKPNGEGYSGKYNSVQDGARLLNSALRSEQEKGYESPSPPSPAPPPLSLPPQIILRETQQLSPIQRVIEHVPVPMEVYHTVERQVPVPVPIVREVTREIPVERIVHVEREVPVIHRIPFPQPVPFTVEKPVFVERRIPEPIIRTFYASSPLPPPQVRTNFQVQSNSFPMTVWNKFGKLIRSLTNCCQLNNQ